MRDGELNRVDGEVCLKERGEYSVLALYSDADGIQSFKDEKRLCQRSLGRANVWRSEEGWDATRRSGSASEGRLLGGPEGAWRAMGEIISRWSGHDSTSANEDENNDLAGPRAQD